MVYSDEGEMAEGPTRSRPLHNFEMPPLKWCNQRYLRCKKGDDASIAIDSSSAIPNHPCPHHVFQRNQPPPSKFQALLDVIRDELSDDDDMAKDKDELKESKEKMKEEEIVKKKEKEDSPSITVEERRWNLRPRRAGYKVFIDGEGTSKNYKSSEKKKSPKVRGKGLMVATTTATTENQSSRPKFSVSLTKKEIEEDFIKMTGGLPPKKATKRTRKLQKQLDPLLPGLWLTEVNPDSYNV